MVELENCSLNTFDYSVVIPENNSPSELETFFSISFFCNGATFTSPYFSDLESILDWAETELGDFGTWSLDGSTLTVTGTLCETASLTALAGETIVRGCTNEDAENFDTDANVNDGSCVFGDSFVTFNLGASQAVQTKIGANIFEADVSKLSIWTPISTQLGLQVYYYLLLSGNLPAGTISALNSFLSGTGANVGINYPLEVAAVIAGYPALLTTMSSSIVPKPLFVQLGQETISGTGMTQAQYVARAQQAITFLNGQGILSSWDAGLIYKFNADTLARNAALAPLTDTIYARQYEQISPDIVTLTTNQDNNFTALNNYYDVILPGFLTNLLAALPNVTKEVIEQWQNEDVGTTLLSDPLANWSIGEMARFTLAHTTNFAYLIWLTLGNLITHALGAEREYDSIKRIVPAFKFTDTMPVSIAITGSKAQGFRTGANSWGLLITNYSANWYTLSPTDIKITGKTVSGNFSIDTGYGSSWNSGITNSVTSQSTLEVRPYSTSFITFTTI